MKERLKQSSLWGLLHRTTESSPDSVGLLGPDHKRISYSELFENINTIAGSLTARGIRRNDRVAVVLPNGPDLAIGILGVSLTAACAPLNPTYRSSEFESLFADLRPQLLVVESAATCAADVARSLSVPIIEFSQLRSRADQSEISNRNPVDPRGAGASEPDDIALLLFTSGTTARPKLVSLTHRNLTASALNVATSLQLTSADRCLNPMPLFHIHGLVAGLLAPLSAGSAVVCTSPFDPEEFFRLLGEFRPTWFTAVPTMHQVFVRGARRHAESLAKTSLRFVRSCSAPLPKKLMAELEELFDAPVIQAYGMTEAAHQITSNPLPPKARKAGSVGMPSGTEVAIMNPQGTPVSPGELGEVIIRGPGLTSGYANSPEATRDRFSCGWLRTGDQGYLDDEGYLFLTGRLDEVINRGGENISPAEVDEVLQEHPAVKEAVTFPVRHRTLGQDLAAAVVPHDGTAVNPIDLQRFASTRLAGFKIPRHVVIVNEIPKTASGKMDRRSVAKQFASRSANEETGTRELLLSVLTPKRKLDRENLPGPDDSRPKLSQAFVAARTTTEKKLTEIWQDVLDLNRVGIYDNFFDLGGHSLIATVIAGRIRKTFEIEFPLGALFERQTIAELAAMIAAMEPDWVDLPKVHRIISEVEKLTEQDSERLLMRTK